MPDHRPCEGTSPTGRPRMVPRREILARHDELARRVSEAFAAGHGRVGAARIAAALTADGFPASKSAVARVMRREGLHAKRLPVPRVELVELVQEIHAQHLWGAGRVAAELARRDVPVSEGVVAQIMRDYGMRGGDRGGVLKLPPDLVAYMQELYVTSQGRALNEVLRRARQAGWPLSHLAEPLGISPAAVQYRTVRTAPVPSGRAIPYVPPRLVGRCGAVSEVPEDLLESIARAWKRVLDGDEDAAFELVKSLHVAFADHGLPVRVVEALLGVGDGEIVAWRRRWKDRMYKSGRRTTS
ncbi:IS3 family transposase [Nocardia sp. NPDC050435]|uniref:IS3 family transposase n=1 Tax=Nocardia sp. NPDC050435 TaxID=3155040 RepID=UPI0033D0A315